MLKMLNVMKLFVLFLTVIPIFLIPIYADENLFTITNNTSDSIKPQIFTKDNFVYLVYMDHPNEKSDIFFTKSDNKGLTFEPPKNLSDNNGTSAWPRFTVYDSNIYVTWYDYSAGTSDIFFSVSEDNGNTFKTSNLWENKGVSFNPWIKVFEDSVYIVWNDDTPNFIPINKTSNIDEIDISFGNTDILVAVSNDKGKSFKIHNLSNTFSTSDTPRIAINGENVYVAWDQNTKNGFDIAFSASHDNGLTFSDKLNISNSSSMSTDSGIGAYENNVYVIWMESVGGPNDIFLSKSDDYGAHFSSTVNLSNSSLNSFIVRDGSMVVWKDNIYIVWTDSSEENSEVFFVKSNDGAKSFTTPVKLSGSERAGFSQIVADKQNIYVVWEEGSEDQDNASLFLRPSYDSGETFGSVSKINSPTPQSRLSVLGPQISLTNDDVYVIFEGVVDKNSNLLLQHFDRIGQSDASSVIAIAIIILVIFLITVLIILKRDSFNLKILRKKQL